MNNAINYCFTKEGIEKSKKYSNNTEVIKCAKSLKDLFKDFNNLKSAEQRIAAILLAEKMLEEKFENNL